MNLSEYLSSGLLPRTEKRADVFTKESYWGMVDTSVYTYGFNNATYADQSKPIIQHIQEMNEEKFNLLLKYKDYEVKQVKVFSSDDKEDIHIHILI